MENIIYNELRFRGFKLDVGVVESREKNAEGKETRKQLEIDFIATLGNKKYYIQSAYAIPDDGITCAFSGQKATSSFL
jgi:predicted AAA+ superfamily ATPase